MATLTYVTPACASPMEFQVTGSKWAMAYGFVSILFLTPCLGFALRDIPLSPREFTLGECSSHRTCQAEMHPLNLKC